MIDCLVYFSVFAVVFVLNTIAMRQKNKRVRGFLVATSFLVLLLFVGFRYDVGTDYDNYLNMYGTIANTSWEKLPGLRMELLVSVIFKICSCVFADPRLIFLVLGFFLLFPIYIVNRLYNYKYLAYSVLIFCVLFLPFGLNGMRQGIAMSFVLLAFVRFSKKNIWMGIVAFVASALFHTSALIILPYIAAIYVNKRWGLNFTRMNTVITVFLSASVLFFLNDLLLQNGITQYNYMLGSTNIDNITLRGILFYIPIIFLILFLRNGQMDKKEYTIMKNLIMSGMCLFVVGTSAQYLNRLGMYFIMPSIILLPELLQNITSKQMRLFIKCAFITYLVMFFVMQYEVYGYHDILPYKTWLFGHQSSITTNGNPTIFGRKSERYNS